MEDGFFKVPITMVENLSGGKFFGGKWKCRTRRNFITHEWHDSEQCYADFFPKRALSDALEAVYKWDSQKRRLDMMEIDNSVSFVEFDVAGPIIRALDGQ